MVSAMADMARSTLPLYGRLMPTTGLPEVIYLLVAPEAQAWFFAAQISRDSTAVRLMACATALGGKGLMLMRRSARSGRGVTGKAHLAFGLIEQEAIFACVGLMTVATFAALEWRMAVTRPRIRFKLSCGVFVTLKA